MKIKINQYPVGHGCLKDVVFWFHGCISSVAKIIVFNTLLIRLNDKRSEQKFLVAYLSKKGRL